MNTFGLEPMCWLVFKNVDGCGEGCGGLKGRDRSDRETLHMREERERDKTEEVRGGQQTESVQTGKHCHFQKTD